MAIWSAKRRLIRPFAPLLADDKLAQIAKWCRFVENYRDCPMFPSRENMYAHIQETILGSGAMDYLEFGVADGASIVQWAALNRHPETRFWGFDSFQGLPDAWQNLSKGTFNRNGQPPETGDRRIRFEVGLFQETLPSFLRGFDPRHQLVVHADADLYSATLYLMTQLDPYAQAGTVVIFDEFWDASHEFRALMDYSTAYLRDFSIIAATRYFGQVAVMLHGSTTSQPQAAQRTLQTAKAIESATNRR